MQYLAPKGGCKMKFLKRLLIMLMLAVCLCGLLPPLAAPGAAAVSPVMVLTSSNAINPLLTLTLDPGIFRTGGPFTVQYEWKSELQPLNGSSESHAFSSVTGTIYGSNQQQTGSAPIISGYTDWTQASFTFQHVGYFDLSYGQQAGNVLRIGLWQSIGTLYVRNFTIKNSAGYIVYDFNARTAAQVNQMVANGQTYAALPTYYSTYDYSVWMSQKFGDGSYSAGLRLMESSPTTKPTSKPTAPPATQDPCANGHRYQNGYCIYCAKVDPNYNPCQKGHTFENGFCIHCGIQDPHFDPCANGHDYENGYCVRCLAADPSMVKPIADPCAAGHSFTNGFCASCGKTDLSFDPCRDGHTFVGAACLACDASTPAAPSKLMPILLVSGLGLAAAAALLILILGRKKHD